MRDRVYLKFIVVILVLGLLFSIFLYSNNIRFKHEIGKTDFALLADTHLQLKHTISYLESGSLYEGPGGVKDNLFLLSASSRTVASTSALSFIDLHLIIKDYGDHERVSKNKEYREKLLTELKAYDYAFQSLYDEVLKYSDFEKRFYGKRYYDYFSKRAFDRDKYKTRAEEIFFSKFIDN